MPLFEIQSLSVLPSSRFARLGQPPPEYRNAIGEGARTLQAPQLQLGAQRHTVLLASAIEVRLLDVNEYCAINCAHQ